MPWWKVGSSFFVHETILEHRPRPKNCIWMPKQTASAAQFSSATNHQSVKWLQAVWLVGNEIGFTLERTQHTELLFFFFLSFNGIPGTLLESPVRWGPTCGPACGWGTGEGGERCTAQRRSGRGAHACLSVKWRGEESFLVHLSAAWTKYICSSPPPPSDVSV